MEVYTLFDTVFIVIYLGPFSFSPGKLTTPLLPYFFHCLSNYSIYPELLMKQFLYRLGEISSAHEVENPRIYRQ
jgi:hypothetical protein